MAYRQKKHGKNRVKRKHHAYSILQEDDSYCYLCNMLYGDDSPQRTEEHHIFFGPLRDKSEAEGLKVRLCIRHHRTGPDAVHKSDDTNRLLKKIAQEAWEKAHSREEWMQLMGRSYLEREPDKTPAEKLIESFKAHYPNLESRISRSKEYGSGKVAIELENKRILIWDGQAFRIWREGDT